jgi:hypothetical protein
MTEQEALRKIEELHHSGFIDEVEYKERREQVHEKYQAMREEEKVGPLE